MKVLRENVHNPGIEVEKSVDVGDREKALTRDKIIDGGGVAWCTVNRLM